MTRGIRVRRADGALRGTVRSTRLLRKALAVVALASALAFSVGASSALAATSDDEDLPPYTWSVTMLDGAHVTSRDPFGGMMFVPGEPLTSGYLLHHTPDINGALELSATPRTPPNPVEDELWITIGVNGTPGEAVRLSDMLRNGESALATSALPEGTVRFDVSIELEADSVNYSALEMLKFAFAITVSDREAGVPTTPEPTTTPRPSTSPLPTTPGDGDGSGVGSGDGSGDGDGTGGAGTGGTGTDGTDTAGTGTGGTGTNGRALRNGATGLSVTGPAFVGLLVAVASVSITAGLILTGRRRSTERPARASASELDRTPN